MPPLHGAPGGQDNRGKWLGSTPQSMPGGHTGSWPMGHPIGAEVRPVGPMHRTVTVGTVYGGSGIIPQYLLSGDIGPSCCAHCRLDGEPTGSEAQHVPQMISDAFTHQSTGQPDACSSESRARSRSGSMLCSLVPLDPMVELENSLDVDVLVEVAPVGTSSIVQAGRDRKISSASFFMLVCLT